MALSTWKPDSTLFQMFGVMKRYLPAPPDPPPPSPFAWGSVDRLQGLLGASFDLAFETGTNHFRFPSPEAEWDFWVANYGPTKVLAASLDDARREAFRRDMIDFFSTFRTPLGVDQPSEYVITVGVRK